MSKNNNNINRNTVKIMEIIERSEGVKAWFLSLVFLWKLPEIIAAFGHL